MLLQLLYASRATHPLDETGLDSILAASRRNNAERGVTGMLLYRDGLFLQLLEGPAPAVRGLYGRITADPRHRNAMVLMERTASARAFGEWSMGFDRLSERSRADQRCFDLSRAALESRIAPVEGGLVLDTVLAFAAPGFLAPR